MPGSGIRPQFFRPALRGWATGSRQSAATKRRLGNSASGTSPVLEPKLNAILRRDISSGHLNFTTSYREAMQQAEFAFIAIDTPVNERDEPQLETVWDAARRIGQFWNSGTPSSACPPRCR